MDNVTHTFAGLLLATAAVRWTLGHAGPGATSERLRPLSRVAAIVGVIGANLPDSDVPWLAVRQAMGREDTLSTMLAHRGYTHTLLAAAVWIPLLWAAALWLHQQLVRAETTPAQRTRERRMLLLLSAAAVLSHTLLDFTNDYGVHPLSPIVDRWFYGDTIFIIEPWLWVVSVCTLLRTTTRRGPQAGLAAILAIGIALCWIAPQVSFGAALAVSAGAGAGVLLSRRLSPAVAPAAGLAAWVVVTISFAAGMQSIRAEVRRATPLQAAVGAVTPDTAHLFDIIVSPSAANPLCARVITVDASAARYRLTTAWAAAVPSLISAAQCAAHTDTTRGAPTLPMERATFTSTDGVRWGWSWSAVRGELTALSGANCRLAAWLRFVRAPVWRAVGLDSLRVDDLRYARDANVRVAGFTLPRIASGCATSLPPWTPPRHDVWPELMR